MLIQIYFRDDGLYVVELQSNPTVHAIGHSIGKALKKFSRVLPEYVEMVGTDVLEDGLDMEDMPQKGPATVH
jgi:predicted RNase H-like HicB family nuclease